jgi:hypothetical protein
MASFNRFLGAFCALALAAMACGVTVDLGIQPPAAPVVQISGPEQVATIVAQTLQAFTQQALSATPLATSSPTPSRFPVPAALSVSVATECYAGPSSNYGFVITLRPGAMAKVVGQDPADNDWIIEAPGYPGTVCWLSGQYAKVTGDTSSLPAPATPVASTYTLSEPRNLRISCSSESAWATPEPWWHHESEATVTFLWTNTDPDQSGVRIYRNGWQVTTLGAHASSYTETLTHNWRHELTYGVQAFTRTAVSSIVTIEMHHCH